MKVLKSINSIRSFIQKEKLKSRKIGFVPTMGALHDGHLSLVKKSIKENQICIVSIFVNQAQFNKIEDFTNYPQTISEDQKKLETIGCDVLFLPSHDEIYPNNDSLKFNFGFLETIMEGQYRPGHFSGVGLIVSKLLNLVQPNVAYFGEKDLQQLAVIKKLTKDLNFNVEIIGVPTVRESSGLAMSSRNLRLSNKEKEISANIYKGLKLGEECLRSTMKPLEAKEKSVAFFDKINGLNLEYLEIVESNSLLPIKVIKPNQSISICVAAILGNVRLIDNISFTLN